MATAAGIKAGKAFVEMSLEDKTQRQLKVTEQNLKSFANSVDAMSVKLGAFGTASLTAFGYFIKQASDARETLNKFNAVFGSFSGNANQFATDFGKRIGRDVNNLRDGMAAMDALIVGVGVQRDQATEMVKELTAGAVDFGSFFNKSDEESFQRFLSALSGSVEVMDQFGINLKQAAINQQLVSMGFPTIAEGATEAQKVMARYAIIMQTLGRIGATGDAARTAGEFANMLKRQKAEIKTVSVAIGNALLPAVKALQAESIPYLESLREWIEMHPDMVHGAASLAVAVSAVAAGLLGLSVATKGYIALRGGILAIESATKAAVASTLTLTGAVASQDAAQKSAAASARALSVAIGSLLVAAAATVWIVNQSEQVRELNRELKEAVKLSERLADLQANRFAGNIQGKTVDELERLLEQQRLETAGSAEAVAMLRQQVEGHNWLEQGVGWLMPGQLAVDQQNLRDAEERLAANQDQERQILAAINEQKEAAAQAEVEGAEKAAEVKAEASKAEQKAAEEAQRKLHAMKLRDAAELALREGDPEQQALALDAAAAAMEEFDQPLADLYRNLAAIAAQQAGAGVQAEAASALNDNLFVQALGNDNDPALKRQYAQAGVQLAKAQGNSLAQAFFEAILSGLDEQEQQLAEVADLPTFDPAEIAAQANTGLEVGTREAVRALAEAFAPQGAQTHDQQMETLTKQLLTEAQETNKLLDDQLQNPAIVIGQV